MDPDLVNVNGSPSAMDEDGYYDIEDCDDVNEIVGRDDEDDDE